MASTGQIARTLLAAFSGLEQGKEKRRKDELAREDEEWIRKERERKLAMQPIEDETNRLRLEYEKNKFENEYMKPEYAPLQPEQQGQLKDASAGALTSAMLAGGFPGLSGMANTQSMQKPELMPQPANQNKPPSLMPIASERIQPPTMLGNLMEPMAEASSQTPAFTGQMLKRDVPASMEYKQDINEMRRDIAEDKIKSAMANKERDFENRMLMKDRDLENKMLFASMFGRAGRGGSKSDDSGGGKEESRYNKAMADEKLKLYNEYQKNYEGAENAPDFESWAKPKLDQISKIVLTKFPGMSAMKEKQASDKIKNVTSAIGDFFAQSEKQKINQQPQPTQQPIQENTPSSDEMINKTLSGFGQKPIDLMNPVDTLALSEVKRQQIKDPRLIATLIMKARRDAYNNQQQQQKPPDIPMSLDKF